MAEEMILQALKQGLYLALLVSLPVALTSLLWRKAMARPTKSGKAKGGLEKS